MVVDDQVYLLKGRNFLFRNSKTESTLFERESRLLQEICVSNLTFGVFNYLGEIFKINLK